MKPENFIDNFGRPESLWMYACSRCGACIDVCPVEALTRDPNTGAILVNDSVCIGCRACMVVCPYGAIGADIDKKTITKCDLCNGEPACVQWCPTDAIRYIDAAKADIPKRRIMMEKMSKSILKSRESQKTD